MRNTQGIADDLAAINAWLAARAPGSPHTQRASRREAQQLLVWAVFVRDWVLASLDADAAIAYLTCITDTTPGST